MRPRTTAGGTSYFGTLCANLSPALPVKASQNMTSVQISFGWLPREGFHSIHMDSLSVPLRWTGRVAARPDTDQERILRPRKIGVDFGSGGLPSAPFSSNRIGCSHRKHRAERGLYVAGLDPIRYSRDSSRQMGSTGAGSSGPRASSGLHCRHPTGRFLCGHP